LSFASAVAADACPVKRGESPRSRSPWDQRTRQKFTAGIHRRLPLVVSYNLVAVDVSPR